MSRAQESQNNERKHFPHPERYPLGHTMSRQPEWLHTKVHNYLLKFPTQVLPLQDLAKCALITQRQRNYQAQYNTCIKTKEQWNQLIRQDEILPPGVKELFMEYKAATKHLERLPQYVTPVMNLQLSCDIVTYIMDEPERPLTLQLMCRMAIIEHAQRESYTKRGRGIPPPEWDRQVTQDKRLAPGIQKLLYYNKEPAKDTEPDDKTTQEKLTL